VYVVCANVALAAPQPGARDSFKLAAQLDERGEHEKALVVIDDGPASAPGDVPLLGLKGAVLMKLHDDTGALKDNGNARCASQTAGCSAMAVNDLQRRADSRTSTAEFACAISGATLITTAILWFTARESRVAVTARVGRVSGPDLALTF